MFCTKGQWLREHCFLFPCDEMDLYAMICVFSLYVSALLSSWAENSWLWIICTTRTSSCVTTLCWLCRNWWSTTGMKLLFFYLFIVVTSPDVKSRRVDEMVLKTQAHQVYRNLEIWSWRNQEEDLHQSNGGEICMITTAKNTVQFQKIKK